MSSRILTSDVIGIDALLHDHHAVLAKSTGGAVAVFANNAPAFYAVTPARMAELLALEEKLSRPGSDVALDAQFYEEPEAAPLRFPAENSPCIPPGNRMRIFSVRLPFGAWRFGSRSPQKSWRRLSPTGRRKVRFSPYPVAAKLARSVQISRSSNGGMPQRDINSVSEPDNHIPPVLGVTMKNVGDLMQRLQNDACAYYAGV